MHPAHRDAEALATQAAAALAEDRKDEALALYARAASSELEAFSCTPSDRTRTRNILAVSLVSLFYKARLYDDAERQIFGLLASREVAPWAESQLRELLEVVTDERFIEVDLERHYTGHTMTVSLRGGQIGSGTGPLDLVLDKAAGFRSLLYRMAEFVGNFPLRIRGGPPRELLELLQVRATQPAVGSYRLEIRLTEPAQMNLLEGPPVDSGKLSDTLFAFVSALNAGPVEAMEAVVPDPGYRKALLELVRNVAPTGRRLDEIGLYRTKCGEQEAVYLTESVRGKVKERLPLTSREPDAEPQEVRGVLRALHLDENWLEITDADGHHEKCDAVPDMLDDVVGPLVNQEVVLRGVRRKKGGGAVRLLVHEIEASEPD